MTTNNKPAAKIQDGQLQIAIWRRETEKGNRYSFTLRKQYKDGQEWKDTDFYDRDDALKLAHMLPKAHDKLNELRAADRANSQN